MDPDQVRRLEEEIDAAIVKVLEKHFPGPLPSPRTTHWMATAAVAVLEAVAEKPSPPPPRPAGR